MTIVCDFFPCTKGLQLEFEGHADSRRLRPWIEGAGWQFPDEKPYDTGFYCPEHHTAEIVLPGAG